MPRDYDAWRWGGEFVDRAEFDEKMSTAFYGRPVDPMNVREVVDTVGRRRLTEILSGSTDTKSRAYRNQRDNISRWLRQGRRPTRSRTKLTAAVSAARRQQVERKGRLGFRTIATVRVSSKPWRSGRITGTLAGRNLTDFLNAADGGDWEMAAQIGFEQYGLNPNSVRGLEGLSDVDFT